MIWIVFVTKMNFSFHSWLTGCYCNISVQYYDNKQVFRLRVIHPAKAISAAALYHIILHPLKSVRYTSTITKKKKIDFNTFSSFFLRIAVVICRLSICIRSRSYFYVVSDKKANSHFIFKINLSWPFYLFLIIQCPKTILKYLKHLSFLDCVYFVNFIVYFIWIFKIPNFVNFRNLVNFVHFYSCCKFW